MTWLWIVLIVLFLIGVVLNAIDGLKAQDKWLEARQKKKLEHQEKAQKKSNPKDDEDDDWGW